MDSDRQKAKEILEKILADYRKKAPAFKEELMILQSADSMDYETKMRKQFLEKFLKESAIIIRNLRQIAKCGCFYMDLNLHNQIKNHLLDDDKCDPDYYVGFDCIDEVTYEEWIGVN